MKNLLFLLLVFFISCSSKTNFDKVKIGMKSSEVVSLVGSPKQKMSMIMVEWWIYNDANDHVIVIGGDTVVNITTQKEFKKGMDDIKNSMDSLTKTLDSASH